MNRTRSALASIHIAAYLVPLLLACTVATDDLASGALPDRQLTPGAVLDVTAQDICTPGYTKKIRKVPAAVKREVFREYGIEHAPGAYDVDHLISLELGGSNSIRNLWPEPYEIVWNARREDTLEGRLHPMVCNGSISVKEAQDQIARTGSKRIRSMSFR
jgi:hypothetical protein